MSKKEKFLFIKHQKLNLTSSNLCGTQITSPNTFRLHDFVEEVMSYSFDETPNYNKLKFLLTKGLIDSGTMPSKDYDWIKLLKKGATD
jgi:hypothetical protein